MTLEETFDRLEMDIQKVLHRNFKFLLDADKYTNWEEHCDKVADDTTEEIMHFAMSYFNKRIHLEDEE